MSSTIEKIEYIGNGADTFYQTLSAILPKKERKITAPDMVFLLPSQHQGHFGLVPLRSGY